MNTDIQLFNTLTKQKEVFTPLHSAVLKMYNCGPTVYSKPHIGNMRAYIFADTISRVFSYNKYHVQQVINITDVGHLTDDSDDGDDKMELQAKTTGKTAQEVATEYTAIFYDYLDKLHINREAITFSKATDNIPEQITMITALLEKNHAYTTSDGIYFDTATFPEYGKLGNIHTYDNSNHARIIENNEKKQPADFALWKFSNPEDQRQQEWDTPWGVGFPGWHIECSAMAQKFLGDTIDIHTGGIDHIPTHHNNEIAQTESLTNKPLANYWMHSSHILFEGERFAKSTGHVLYFEDLEAKNISALAYRYWVLTADYKTLVNFTWDAITAADKAFKKMITTVAKCNDAESGTIQSMYKEKFIAAINDDLNTAAGIAIIWELIKDDVVSNADKAATIFDFDTVLGLNIESLVQLSQQFKDTTKTPEAILEIGKQRAIARENKDWDEADRLRAEAHKQGFDIQDTQEGITYVPLA